MATINALTENFTGGAVGSALTSANTIFTNISGQGTSIFASDPYVPGGRMMSIASAVNFRTHEVNFPTQSQMWFAFDIEIVTALDSNTAVMIAYDVEAATNKVLDIRLLAGTRTLQMRNVNVAEWTSPVLSAGQKYRLYVWMKVDTGKNIRCVLYGGPDYTTLISDSGTVASSTVATTVGHIRVGTLSNSTGEIKMGRLRGDTAVMPTDSVAYTQNPSDNAALSDAMTIARGVMRNENLGITDTPSVNVIGPSSWTYTKAIQIG